MPVLGSSPLGLIMHSSDNSRVKIGLFSRQDVDGNNYYTSLFGRDSNNTSTNLFNYNEDKDANFDISTEEIIKYTQDIPMMRLTYADFAYLRDLGVYPNNRLIIARRYPAPVDDDLISNQNTISPLSTLITWVPDNQEFFKVTYNEKWVDADTSFAKLFDEASKNTDIMGGDNKGTPVGTALAQGLSLVPLLGWTEGLQYQIFKQFGLTDLDATKLPFGNPNLMRSALQRDTAPKEGKFEGMNANIEVTMKVVYEQKFISKIDPTGVYYDIIANALSFGTSNAVFMFKSDALGADNQFASFLNDLGSGDVNRFKSAISTFAGKLADALTEIGKAIAKAVVDFAGGVAKAVTSENPVAASSDFIIGKLNELLSKIAAGIVSKYKIRIIGILDSLTGSPSTPWHVTIGNPKRPVFSSGDMYVTSVTVTLGKLLAYNDLPSTITIDVQLRNARGLGAQEIYRKMNCGKARSYTKLRLDIGSTDFQLDTLPRVNVPTFSVDTQATGANAVTSGGAPTTNANNNEQIGSLPRIQLSNVKCAEDYNFVINELVKVVVNKGDNYDNGKPLLAKFISGLNDDEAGAIKAVKDELIGNRLASRINSITCPEIKSKLQEDIEKVYKAMAASFAGRIINLTNYITNRAQGNEVPFTTFRFNGDI